MSRGSVYTLFVAALLAGIWFGNRPVSDSHTEQPLPLSLPQTAFTDLAGETKSLNDWSENHRLVNFWATWCEPCREEMPMLQAVHRRYAEKSFKVLGIALDNPDKVARFTKELGIDYPILISDLQKGMDLMTQLGNPAGGIPYTVLLSKSGAVLETKLGTIGESEIESWLDRVDQ